MIINYTGERTDPAESWFARHGTKAVLFGRVLPVVRPLISIPAGAQRMPLPKFVTYTAIGCLLWTSALLLAGYVLGESWHRVTDVAGTFSYVALGALAVGIVLFRVRRRIRRRKEAAAEISEKTHTEVR